MGSNLLVMAQQISEGDGSVISTKWAARFLNLSYTAFKQEIDPFQNQGTIKWQARIDDEDNSRPILGFALDYLEGLNKILGKKRIQGKRIFTPEIKARIHILNEQWKLREFDLNLSEKRAEAALEKLKRKRP